MLDEAADPEFGLALAVLDQILTGTPASPLRKALIDSGLGEEVISYLQFEFRQVAFNCGLKGIAAEHASKVETLILDTLRSLSAKGIEKNTIESAINTIEFRLRENNTGRFPRGLALMLRAMTTWLHEGDPLDRIAFEAPFARLKARLAKGERVFEDIIQSRIVDNPHRVTALVKPDPTQADREAEEEKARLAAVRAKLTPDDLKQLSERTAALKRWQETADSPEAIATIPSLKLSDLPKQNKSIPVAFGRCGGVELLTHDLFTNGILYLDLAFDLKALSAEHLPLLDVFSRALLETGAGSENFVALSERIGRSTGGIGATSLVSSKADRSGSAARLVLRAKAVPEKTDELVAILRDVLTSAHLDDRERIQQIVLEEKASAESMLAPAGHMLVMRRLRAFMSEDGWVQEQIGGFSRLFALRALADRIERDWPSVARDLADMRRRLITQSGLVANVTGDAAMLARFEPKLAALVSALPAVAPAGGGSVPWPWNVPARDEAFSMPAKVNYVAKGGDIVALGFEPGGSALVVDNFLSTSYLWDKVRVQGGAYGGFSRFDRLSGAFVFASYRDPNLTATLDIYDKAAEHLATVPLGEAEIRRSIIGTIGGVDGYLLPDAKGYTSLIRHLTANTDAARQRMRDEILATSVADFRRFGEALAAVAAKGRITVLGSETAIAKANEERGGNWLKVTKVL